MNTAAGKSSFGTKLTQALLQLMRSRRRALTGQQPHAETTLGDKPLPAKQREVRFSDFEAVAKLQERSGWSKDSVENWERLWRTNPAIAASKSPLSMGWVLESGGRIVGYSGSVPLLYHYGDRVLLVAAGTGLMVDPAYRFRSAGLLSSFFRQENIELFLITTAIESVGKMSKLLKAETLPQQDYDTTLFWVLNSSQFAKVVVKKFGMAGNVGNLVALMGSLAVRTEMMLLSRGLKRISSNFQITEIQVHQIGNDFDDLWRRKLTEKPCLLADRSQASLRWHLTIPGCPGETSILCCHREGRLAGYAVVKNLTDEKTGLCRCTLIDLLVEADDSSVTESLLAAAYTKARTSGSHVFEVLGFPRKVREILARWKPYSRQYPACPFLFKTNDAVLHAILEQEDAWYACPFDGDTTLMPY
jgi:hypothetical protein